MPIKVYTAGAWSRLRDAFDLKGKHQLQLDEVIVPVVVVDDLSPGKIAIGQDATVDMQQIAVVGEKASLLLENPAGSGSNLLIDRITISSATTSILTVRLTQTAPLNAMVGGSANISWNNPDQVGTPPGVMFADHGTFTGDVRYQHRSTASTPAVVLPKIVLPPSWLIQCVNGSSNVTLAVTLNFRVQRITQ